MKNDNIILQTDSYKLTHHGMYPEDCEKVYSYLEARKGATHDEVLFNGLQPILHRLAGVVVTQEDIDEAAEISAAHFGDDKVFNRGMWEHIVNEHGGKLPIRIKAVAEGTMVPTGNVMMTVENTGGPITAPLTNALESFLLHVWYPITVGTISADLRKTFKNYKALTSEDDFVDFMLHDFGYRGVSSDESARIGGAAHLLSFLGTDTLVAMLHLKEHYFADLSSTAFSVNATEHSVMTADGQTGELDLMRRLINKYDTGILSMVSDSYSIKDVVEIYIPQLKDDILARKKNAMGVRKFVVRPDSLRDQNDSPAAQMLWITEELAKTFGYETNSKGFRVLNPEVGVLWGDGIDPEGIKDIVEWIVDNRWSIDHLVFGMGGGLLQKVNRDTERFAFKCSAQKRNGEWVQVVKNPMDHTKKSKAGRMKLVNQIQLDESVQMVTITDSHPLFNDVGPDLLETVFEDGEIKKVYKLDEIRAKTMA